MFFAQFLWINLKIYIYIFLIQLDTSIENSLTQWVRFIAKGYS